MDYEDQSLSYFRNLFIFPLVGIFGSIILFCGLAIIGFFALSQPSLNQREFCKLIDKNIDYNECLNLSRTDALNLAFPLRTTDINIVNQAIGDFRGSSQKTESGNIEFYYLESPIAFKIFGETYWEFRYDENDILTAIDVRKVSLSEG